MSRVSLIKYITILACIILSGCSTRVYPDTMIVDKDSEQKQPTGLVLVDVKF